MAQERPQFTDEELRQFQLQKEEFQKKKEEVDMAASELGEEVQIDKQGDGARGFQTNVNLEDINNIAQFPGPKDRQPYSNWYFMSYTGSSTFYVNYGSTQGGSISLQKGPLLLVLDSLNLQNDKKSHKSFQFQQNDDDFIRKYLNARKASSSSDQVTYKFVRCNYSNEALLLYSKTYKVKPRSTQLDHLIESYAISMTIKDFLDPLEHLRAPSLTVTTEANIVFTDDI